MKALLGSMVVALLLEPLTAYGFVRNLNGSGQAQRWLLSPPHPLVSENVFNRSTGAIRFYLPINTYSAADKEAELNAIRAAMGQWQAVPGTLIRFEEAGFSGPDVDVNDMDDTNVIFWARSTLVNGGFDDIRGTLAVTFHSVFLDNTMAEADIVLNGVERRWTADVDSQAANYWKIEAVLLHELGHVLGLEHSPIGGATMHFGGSDRDETRLGLSEDEVAFARSAYGDLLTQGSVGTLAGRIVSSDGVGVHGAVVVVENDAGIAVAGTVSRKASALSNPGDFSLPGLAPGTYHVRVTPLDPSSAQTKLLVGSNIAETWLDFEGNEWFQGYEDAITDFLPIDGLTVTILAGNQTPLTVAVQRGEPAFRIARIRRPTTNQGSHNQLGSPVVLRPGDAGLIVGVYGLGLPIEDSVLEVTGGGIDVSPVSGEFRGQLGHLWMTVSVHEDAMAGSRSFVVRRGDDAAFANGYLEILASEPDYNFDGLRDGYQRQFFPVFTDPEASPGSDPDEDGFVNSDEAESDTDPTDRASFPGSTPVEFEVLSVELTEEGSLVTFESQIGQTYQLYSRRDIANDPWVARGASVTAASDTTSVLDVEATDDFRFYHVGTVP